MGNWCESASNVPSHHHHKNKNHNKPSNSNINDSLELSYQKFPDMPLWNNGKQVGYGIKEMPAYKCDLKVNELEKKRKNFWKSHQKHITQWNIIHQACVYPHIKAEEFLAENGFKTLEGCINMLVDRQGNVFRVPNYCINDPYFEIQLKPKSGGSNNNILNIILINVSKNSKINMNVNENTKGIDIMNNYAKINNIDLNCYIIRLLYGGGLIREDETLYQHKVKNGDMIQISVFKRN